MAPVSGVVWCRAQQRCAVVGPDLCGLGGGQQGEQAAGSADGQHIVEGRIGGAQHVEAGKDDDGQEQCVVVEDGEGGGLVVGHLVLLPQRALVLLLAAHLLVVAKHLGHFAGDGVLALKRNLVLDLVLGVAIGHRHQVGAQGGD